MESHKKKKHLVNSPSRVSFSLLLLLSLLSVSVSATVPPPYAPSCNRLVPESPPTGPLPSAPFLRLSSTFFSGGAPFFPPSNSSSSRSVSLRFRSLSATLSPSTLALSATLSLSSYGSPRPDRRNLRRVINRHPRIIPARDSYNAATFRLQGFYSRSARRLCMVGNGLVGFQTVGVVFTLDYPNVSSLETGFVSGTVVDTGGSGLFGPVSMLGFPVVDNYTYTRVDEEVKKGAFRVYDDTGNAGFSANYGLCMTFRHQKLELEYSEDCEKVGCNPLGGSSRDLPSLMYLQEIDCRGDKVRYLLKFPDSKFGYVLFHPNTSLVAEGAWNEKLHLDLVACRWLNVTDSLTKPYIGDCSIRLSLRLPLVFNLRNRSAVVGMIWSSKKVDDQGYFGTIALQSPTNGNVRGRDPKYVYTVVGNATRACSKKVADKHKKGEKYPNALSSDMRFDMRVRDSKGLEAWGYSSPLSVGDRFYQHGANFALLDSKGQKNIATQTSAVNVSYIISFRPPPGFKLGGDESSIKFVEISAEGTYDPTTGSLCMLGCRHIKSIGKRLPKNGTLDCELVISLQYPSLKSTSGSEVQGTIETKRPKSDPLYFDQLKLSASSISVEQAHESIWAMDFEITMVLISNTLMCIFVILQLIYVKKFPDVLPFISLVMLTVLTLAQLIPLVLNFEALFKVSGNKQNVYLGSGGGWVEVNEVLVRVITMIAFLLEFRLLQQAWSSRLADENSKALWASDKKVLYLSIPMYIGGALIAWTVHLWKSSYYKTRVMNIRYFGYKKITDSFWLDFKSYAGLVLDGFLLPQIVFNVFCNTREKALAPSFYIGTTVVRLLPHAYDLYRAHGSGWYSGGIYADPGMDYYSTMWDIAIFVGGLVFIVLVYLQQRFGGRCFLPRRFRESVEYEEVSVVSTELSTR